jgi:ABC-type dipeptide/oligopeptide/nickel transport system ATPase component
LEREFFERGYGGSQYYDPYQEVVLQIASTAYKTRSGLKASEENRIIANLRETITELDQKSKQFSDMGLWGSSISLDLLSVIETTRGNKLNLINAILEPYISGLKARFDKLAPIYELTNRFVTSINQFLRDKQITYSLHEGLKIYTLSTNGRGVDEIDSAQLSSGEQQLILLFCYVLVAQQTPSVIIIDEPEISLNVVWQRRLISSLHDLSTTENIQFIFASHSIELLAKHRNNVVAMQEDIQ